MADMYKLTVGGTVFEIPIVYRSLNEGFIYGEPEAAPSTGCVPRDFSVDPILMGDSPDSMQVYSPSEAKTIHNQQLNAESSLLHMYLRTGQPAFEHLDQDGFPDCWYHGPCHAFMLACMRDNDPIPRLNGVAGATLLGRTNGGWSGLAMKDLRDKGAPLMGTGSGEWPQWTRNTKYNTDAFKANRVKHKVLEDWYDTSSEVYDQTHTQAQIVTSLLNNQPGSGDWNKFSHAMGTPGLALIDSRFHPVVLNSWDQFGRFGLAVLYDLWPNNYVGLRTTSPA